MSSWDLFNIDDSCEVSYCSIIILLTVVIGSFLLLLLFYIIRRRILKSRLHKIQIIKGPQKNSSEMSIFPKKIESKQSSINKNPIKKKTKVSERQNIPKNVPEKNLKKEEKKSLVVIPKKKNVCVTDRTNNRSINNYVDDQKVLSENLQVEYFEDKDVGTDITTIPKERRGLDKNNSGFDFLNFSNNNGDFSEKNFENFMKLKNKKRMFNNDDSIEFEDVDNFDINHSDRGSFKIENKLEIKDDNNEEFEYHEPKITRSDHKEYNKNNQSPENFNVLREFSAEGMNPYLEEGFIVRQLEENLSPSEKGLEIVKEENEEGDKE